MKYVECVVDKAAQGAFWGGVTYGVIAVTAPTVGFAIAGSEVPGGGTAVGTVP